MRNRFSNIQYKWGGVIQLSFVNPTRQERKASLIRTYLHYHRLVCSARSFCQSPSWTNPRHHFFLESHVPAVAHPFDSRFASSSQVFGDHLNYRSCSAVILPRQPEGTWQGWESWSVVWDMALYLRPEPCTSLTTVCRLNHVEGLGWWKGYKSMANH